MQLRKFISVVLTAALLSGTFASAAVTNVDTKYPFGTLSRQMEELGRGLVAMQTDDGIYLSWRLFSNEDTRFGSGDENITFDIYRGDEKIAAEENTTNYLDEYGTVDSEYYVVSSSGDTSNTVSAFSSGKNYFDIPIDRPEGGTSLDKEKYTYFPNDVTPADVDGDGEYELILKWEPSNSFDSGKDAHHNGNVYIDCYKMNGEKLWRIDMGININAGAHFTQIAAYDFDLDGKAELAMKTAPGTKDGEGNFVSEASLIDDIKNTDNAADYRHSERGANDTGGRVLSGPEFYTVFQGDTGEALDTIYYPHSRGNVNEWGDNWGNRSERYLTGVAYLDGENPSMLAWRGYYAKTTVTAYNLVDKRLRQVADFDTSRNNYSQYAGNGNHNLTVADVDGDGKDEVICGALALDDDLTPLWNSGRGHGDALHIGAYDPTREGYVYFSVHEEYGGSQITGSTNGNDGKLHRGGMTLYDAKDGTELYHVDSDSDQGRGMMANVGAGGYYQFWGAGSFMALGNDTYESVNVTNASSNFRIFWDGDLYDELLDGSENKPLTVTSWNGSSMTSVFTTEGAVSSNSTKANAALTADILGDWREEIVMRRNDNEALRVFVSDIPTEYKIMTLMHDSMYRVGAANEQTAYNQPPHIGFYMDETSFSGPVTELKITSMPEITEYNVGDVLDTRGLKLSLVYENGKEVPITGYIISDNFDSYNTGIQTITVSFGEVSNEFDVTVVTGFKADSEGIITAYDKTAAKNDSVNLPKSIDGVPVKGFADGALKDSGLKHIYIYDSSLSFEGDVFDDTITVHGYRDSTADIYCREKGIPFSVINVNFTYMVDENYDSEDFNSFIGSFIVTQPGDVLASKSIDGITYANNPRTDAWPDATTGIRVDRVDGNTYLVPVAGEFSTGGRNSWLEINEKVDLSTVREYTFQFDIRYPTDCGTLVLTFSDGESPIDAVEMKAGMETDTWYTYTYHYDSEKRLTLKVTRGNEVIDEKDLGISASKYGINKIDFTRNPNGVNNSTLWGGWGNHGMGDCALAHMDNIRVYIPERTGAEFVVTDSYDCPVEGAVISMNGMTENTGADGIALINADEGSYQAVVSAAGYQSKVVDVKLREGKETVPVKLETVPIELEEITFTEPDVKLAAGGYALVEYTVAPDAADYGVKLESSDTSVVTVDENGLINGIKPGTANITASKDGISAVCSVTVLESSDGSPASIVLRGNDTYTPNPWISGGGIQVTASVYDTNGVKLYNAPVDFTYTGADSVDIKYNSIELIPGNDDITVTATLDDITTQKTIKVENANDGYTEHVSSSFDGSLKLLQGKEAQSQKLDGTGITFNVGNRNNGGDGRTGFVIENGVLKAQTGKYNSAGRHAYMTFDDAPTTEDGEFLFETKLTFAAGNEASVKISDGSSEVVTLTPSGSGLTTGVEYLYSIMYTGGEYTQSITNTQTGETSSSKLYTSAKCISRIDFISVDENKETTVTFDDMRLASTSGSIIIRAQIYVHDESGEPVEGAQIKSALGTAVTSVNGRASLDFYTGVNEITVSYDGVSVVKKADINADNNLVSVKLSGGSELTLLDGDSPIYLVQNMDFIRFIKAEYDGMSLANAEITDASFIGKSLIEISAESEEYKVFVWDDNMKPLADVFEK
ncbi:MAG: bacterial Ig-like domain-containing protein [Oscillospiraceae bacterium]|nr:bacterial Ig-like domain-containing protein [Oscillospiraceae bacterium]